MTPHHSTLTADQRRCCAEVKAVRSAEVPVKRWQKLLDQFGQSNTPKDAAMTSRKTRTPEPPERIKMAGVCKIIGRHRATVLRYLADKSMNFPKPKRPPNGGVRTWDKLEVLAWRDKYWT